MSGKLETCVTCYQRIKRVEYKKAHGDNEPFVVPATEQKIENAAEVDFIKSFFAHKNWLYHPATFRCNGTNYTPDFYDAETNTFIEVVGTRQAYHINKDKYCLFRALFPLIKFEIRNAGGTLLEETEGRKHWTVINSKQEAAENVG